MNLQNADTALNLSQYDNAINNPLIILQSDTSVAEQATDDDIGSFSIPNTDKSILCSNTFILLSIFNVPKTEFTFVLVMKRCLGLVIFFES